MPAFMAISGVIGKLLARPRMPSVPKYLRFMECCPWATVRRLLSLKYTEYLRKCLITIERLVALRRSIRPGRPPAPPGHGCGYSPLPERRQKAPPPGWRLPASAGIPARQASARRICARPKSGAGKAKRPFQLRQAAQDGEGRLRLGCPEKTPCRDRGSAAPRAMPARSSARKPARRRNAGSADPRSRSAATSTRVARAALLHRMHDDQLGPACRERRIERGIGKTLDIVQIIDALRQRPALDSGAKTVDGERQGHLPSARRRRAPAARSPSGRCDRLRVRIADDAAPRSRIVCAIGQRTSLAMRERRLRREILPAVGEGILRDVQDAERCDRSCEAICRKPPRQGVADMSSQRPGCGSGAIMPADRARRARGTARSVPGPRAAAPALRKACAPAGCP